MSSNCSPLGSGFYSRSRGLQCLCFRHRPRTIRRSYDACTLRRPNIRSAARYVPPSDARIVE
jgi:hypothetical protein